MNIPFLDSLVNLVSGLGGNQDKSTYHRYTFNELSPEQLMAAYRSDWIARKIVKIPAQDATREWRAWQADKEQITAIENEEKKFKIKQKLREALFKSRLFGGAALVLGVKGAGNWDEPLDLNKIRRGALEYVHVVDRYELAATQLNTDLLSPFYGEPVYYTVSSTTLGSVNIHPSRVVKFVSEKLPSRTIESDPWGDSVIQAIDDAIKNAGSTTQGVAALVEEASVDVIKIPEFMNSVSTAEYRNRVIERFQLAKLGQSVVRSKMLDKEEEWDKQQVNFSNLPEVIRVYLQIAAGSGDIPAVRLLGQSPGGLNATGDSDIRNYYDNVGDTQKNELSPTMEPLDEVIIRSALGDRPPEIHYTWRPLWQPTAPEQAEITLKNTQAVANIYNTGLVPNESLATATQNMLIENGLFPGLESALNEESDDVDENNEEVIEQFKGAGANKPQDLAMNGAQITSLQGIVTAVAQRQLPGETAIQLITVGFPSIAEEKARAIIDPATRYTPVTTEGG